MQQLCDRFVKLLAAFHSHPWTLQRLCEVLLEPQKQYKRLHKLVSSITSIKDTWPPLCTHSSIEAVDAHKTCVHYAVHGG